MARIDRFGVGFWGCRLLLLLSYGLLAAPTPAQEQSVPEVLEPWREWVLWDVPHQECPRLYSNAEQAICVWPSTFELSATSEGAEWEVDVRVFETSWMNLPGSANVWPREVVLGEQPIAVVQREGRPAVKLTLGEHKIKGRFRWNEVPQKLSIPKEIGVLKLVIDGKQVNFPQWDPSGDLWLKRKQGEATGDDQKSLRIYRLIEDGIPTWLRTEVELTVSGKSREEEIGWVLPEGWTIASVESPIPVALDDRGVMRAQVRSGKWTVKVDAFRTQDLATEGSGGIRFSEGAQPAVATEWIGLKNAPEFRLSQIEGLATVDVTQTTYPDKWRRFPVYQWETNRGFRLIEKMRGMGDQRPEGLAIDRQLWLDENGRSYIYRDYLRGKRQQIWRLDVASGYDLGAVRIDGEGQLITSNPMTGSSGVEIRSRDLNVTAIGETAADQPLLATGWMADAGALQVTLNTPPGWRVFAVLGVDEVSGDWLTAWSLLDLFLVLIFALAVYRLFGVTAGIVALLAFALAYHEPFSPRFSWLFLLMPIALLRVVSGGAIYRWLIGWKVVASVALVLFLIPFVGFQLQSALYPQLELSGFRYGARYLLTSSVGAGQREYAKLAGTSEKSEMDYRNAPVSESFSPTVAGKELQSFQQQSNALQVDEGRLANISQDPKAKIQTGPAEPTWQWNDVVCRWNGPVKSDQEFHPVLISLGQHRVITVIRVAMLMLLAALLLRGEFPRFRGFRRGKQSMVIAIVLLIGTCLTSSPVVAQVPSSEMLEELRARLTKPSDAFPGAATISEVGLELDGNQLSMRISVHAAQQCAIPIPGQFADWSPVIIRLDGSEDKVPSVRRDGYVWVLVPQGVHSFDVDGFVSDQGEWVWNFLLAPKYVSINAPGWKVTGVNEEGVPEPQVFFVKEQRNSSDEVAYDQTVFEPLVIHERQLEIGLISRVTNRVTRLTPRGRAISVDIPLLAGEQVLSSNVTVRNGNITVQIGANDDSVVWESELASAPEIELQANTSNKVVERWSLVTSPIWNVSITGLAPTYLPEQDALVPVWQPWPGESSLLKLKRPETVSGENLTISSVTHEVTLGSRQRETELRVELESSLAGEVVFKLDSDTEITSLEVDGNSMPVQRDGNRLMVPTKRGKQRIDIQWERTLALDTVVKSEQIEFPAVLANVDLLVGIPENRWVLWASGPLRGPAVRFWTILMIAVLVAVALGAVPQSPLRRWEWVLLAIGLTQVHMIAAMLVVVWLFLLAYRGRQENIEGHRVLFNFQQILLVILTALALAVLMFVVGEGLLGSPDMFIVGNDSSRTLLLWFEPSGDELLPEITVISVSVWFYRLLMLFWALWLAFSLLKWLKWGWIQFSHGGLWRHRVRIAIPTPEIPITTIVDEGKSGAS